MEAYEIFDYKPLVNNKINSIDIGTIIVKGGDCLDFTKDDSAHQVYIYTNQKDKFDESKMLNFDNNQRFSIDDLIKLNYIEKLEILIDDEYYNELMKH